VSKLPVVAHVSSVGRCGIAEHTTQLVTACRSAEHVIDDRWLDPAKAINDWDHQLNPDVVHLNYHRGLHSRWTPGTVHALGYPTVITFHDTYEVQPDRLPWDLLNGPNVSAMVVHEPCDLQAHPKVHYLPQACPADRGCLAPALEFGRTRPVLGTLGFDFPWKNYDALATITAQVGWGLRIVGQVTEARRAYLAELNPCIYTDGWVDTQMAVAALRECQATAFMYTCANSGTSGAIRLGVAAGRPLFAQHGCRQFRDLAAMPATGIVWTHLEGLAAALIDDTRAGWDYGLVRLRTVLSWETRGADYARLFLAAAETP
jgi:hypothetical protein